MKMYVFSSKGFLDLVLIFRSLIHLELSFICGVKQRSKFILLHVVIQWSQR